MSFIVLMTLFGLLTKAAYGVPLSTSDLKPFIIGGEDAPEGYAPHMAALVFGHRVQYLLCGGPIITRKLILTAAHCIEAVIDSEGKLISSFYILVGSNYWNSGGTVAHVKSYKIHRQWNIETIKYDVGVLCLTEEVKLNKRVAIISLKYDFVGGNVRTFVTGWGVTGPRVIGNIVNLAPTPDKLQLLYQSTLTHEQCQEQMTSVAGHIPPRIQQDVEICAFHSYRHGMCNGDSGSALVCADSGEQIGIVTWGINCAHGAPDVFVRVTGVRDFIDHCMNNHW